jgi:hypothetical protein
MSLFTKPDRQAMFVRVADDIHTVQRAPRVGSIDHVIPPATLRPISWKH